MAADMTRIGLSKEDFEGPRYVRLARISQLLAEDCSTRSCGSGAPKGRTVDRAAMPSLWVTSHEDLRRSGDVASL